MWVANKGYDDLLLYYKIMQQTQKSDTVIIAPITTYERGAIITDENGNVFVKSIKDGKEHFKKDGIL